MKTILSLIIVILSGIVVNEKTNLLDFELPSFQSSETYERQTKFAAGLLVSKHREPSEEAGRFESKRVGIQIFKKLLLPFAGLVCLLWGFTVLGIFIKSNEHKIQKLINR